MSNILKTFCGLYGANVVSSEYNNDGQCQCLGCPGNFCHDCKKRQELVDESWKLCQTKIERCINCQNQK